MSLTQDVPVKISRLLVYSYSDSLPHPFNNCVCLTEAFFLGLHRRKLVRIQDVNSEISDGS